MFFPTAIPFPSIKAVPEGWSFFFLWWISKTLLLKLLLSDLEAISVKYIKRLTPKLMLPALRMGIFLEYFLIWFSSFFENPVVPITTFFFNLLAIFKTSKVHLGTVKSIITFAFLKDSTEFSWGFNPKIFLLIFLLSVIETILKCFDFLEEFISCFPIFPKQPVITNLIFFISFGLSRIT